MTVTAASGSRSLLVAGLFVLGASVVASVTSMFAGSATASASRQLTTLPAAVLVLVAAASALPSLPMLGGARPASSRPTVPEERRRACRRAEFGAFAWLLVAAAWIFGALELPGLGRSLWVAAAAGAGSVACSAALFRAWARLRH